MRGNEMAHTLFRDPNMLGIMFAFCDKPGNEELQLWNLSWPLLILWHEGHISWNGITEDGWHQLEMFYEWLINSVGMEPVF